jgi:2-keto-3-deoxy-L-rhamnonate aldolase RhmA
LQDKIRLSRATSRERTPGAADDNREFRGRRRYHRRTRQELPFQDKQITSYTIDRYDEAAYCEIAKHFDYIWFEMQHSTMSWDEVRRMILACVGVGAAPMIRMPDALESSIQKATDLGAIGIIVPTVDDALEARDAARFSRYPPVGRRSSGGDRSTRSGRASTIARR